jgi:phosphoenolpyruvate carboxylase
MVLAKAEPRIAAQYDQHLAQSTLRDIGQMLRQALAQTIVAVRRVTCYQALLQNNPVLLRSINVRNPYVDPLNLVQVELLRQLRHAVNDAQLHDALLVTINGIAAGMRNTG